MSMADVTGSTTKDAKCKIHQEVPMSNAKSYHANKQEEQLRYTSNSSSSDDDDKSHRSRKRSKSHRFA